MAISVNMGTLKCAGRFIFYTFPLLRFSYFQTILNFFVNIENMKENGNMLIINELWICWLIALK